MSLKEAYNKNYKLLLIIPLVLLIFSFIYLFQFYQQNDDFIKKDVSLTGGTTITIYLDSYVDLGDLKSFLGDKGIEYSVREITSITTGKQEAIIVESPSSSDELKTILEEYFDFELTPENSSTEFTGASLSNSFYKQLLRAILFAFLLMALIVFIIFRTAVPSLAVILAAFADIVMTLAIIDILGLKISSAGIVAFLMLIGYSVDTDIMLTSKLLRHREGDLSSRMLSSFKTGLTMTLTSLAAVIVALLLTASFSETLRQIFLILTIGLSFDLINTWCSNASILKWYIDKKNKRREE